MLEREVIFRLNATEADAAHGIYPLANLDLLKTPAAATAFFKGIMAPFLMRNTVEDMQERIQKATRSESTKKFIDLMVLKSGGEAPEVQGGATGGVREGSSAAAAAPDPTEDLSLHQNGVQTEQDQFQRQGGEF